MTEPGLPQVLAEIAEIAGVDAAWAIADARGGQEITLPATPSKDHWLTLLVGQEAASAICNYFRADHRLRLLIPMGSALRRRQQVAAVLNSAGRGKGERASVHQAAHELGLHKRTIYRYRAKQGGAREQDDGQGEMDV